MTHILLSQPTVQVYILTVVVLYIWGIWTKDKAAEAGAGRLRHAVGRQDHRYTTDGKPAVPTRTPLWLRGMGSLAPAVLPLQASCAAAYRAKFEAARKRIRMCGL